nr:hypothetical protein K4M19_00134 [Agrobacterium fabrum]
MIEGSPLELQQVLINLCKNASQAMTANGQIDIFVGQAYLPAKKILAHGVMPPGDYVLLSVSDNGGGISEAVLPYILNPSLRHVLATVERVSASLLCMVISARLQVTSTLVQLLGMGRALTFISLRLLRARQSRQLFRPQ